MSSSPSDTKAEKVGDRRKLKIAVVQSPSQGRMNGFAEYEGRTVDPPLVVRVGWVTTDAGATLYVPVCRYELTVCLPYKESHL